MLEDLLKKIKDEISEQKVALPSATAFVNINTDTMHPSTLKSLTLSQLCTQQNDLSLKNHNLTHKIKQVGHTPYIISGAAVSHGIAKNNITKPDPSTICENVSISQYCKLGSVILERY